MKLGDVLHLERERRGLSPADAAARLGIVGEEYAALECGASDAERWGPLLAEIAIALGVPAGRLVSGSGRAADARAGEVGGLVREHREQRGLSPTQVAAKLGVPGEDYANVEAGESPLEQWAPLLLAFSEMVGERLFDLLYPGSIPLSALDVDVLRRERLEGLSETRATEG